MKRIRWFLAGAFLAMLCCGIIGTALATVGHQTVEIAYNNIKVTLDGEPVNLVDVNGDPVEPFIINGTTYLPVRAVSGALGLSVGWEQETATVILTTPGESKPTYITRTGSKYHNDPHCNGGTYWEVPFSTATGMGLTPCEKCVLN